MPTPEQLTEAPAWLAETEWVDRDPTAVDVLTDSEVVEQVDRSHAGGWPGFIRTLFGQLGQIEREPSEIEEFSKDLTWETGEVLILRSAPVAVVRRYGEAVAPR